MSLWECRVELEANATEAVEGVLQELGAVEWNVYEDVRAGTVLLQGVFPDEDSSRTAWRELRRRLPRRGVGPVVHRELPDIDWRESYKAHFKAWRCGPLHWVPEWERATRRISRGHVAVYLDPGLAFGTGNHETTRLCCKRLVEYVQKLSPRGRRYRRVVDAGCGSGILAISAAKLGCARVFAFDNDGEAVAIARENARRNRVGKAVRFGVGGLAEQLARRRADLVLANIQADVLRNHASVLVRAVAPGGQLVLSGILAHEIENVRETFRAVAGAGWKQRSRLLGEWGDIAMIAPVLPVRKEKGGPIRAALGRKR